MNKQRGWQMSGCLIYFGISGIVALFFVIFFAIPYLFPSFRQIAVDNGLPPVDIDTEFYIRTVGRLITAPLEIISVVLLWRWKRLGFPLLMFTQILKIIIAFAAGELDNVAVNTLILVAAFVIIYQRRHVLEK